MGSYTAISRWPQDEPRWYETSIGPVLDDHGQIVAATFAARDITERRQSEAQIRRLNRTLQLLYDAGLALNRMLDPREQLETLCNIAMQALRADHSGFFSYDVGNDTVCYKFGVGRGADLKVLQDLHIPVGEPRGLIGWVAHTRLPLYLPDVTADPRWIVTDPEIRSVIWVPIEYEHQLLGLLSMASTHLDAFTADDQQLLELLANQVAVSLENAQLYGASVDAAERRTTLHWLSQEIISTGFEPERIYSAIHQAASELMTVDAFVISVLDETRGEIDMAYYVDRGVRYPSQHITHLQGVSGSVIASGKMMLINDFEQDMSDLDAVQIGDLPVVRSVLAAPMRLGSHIFGALSAQSYCPHAYTLEDSHLLEILAAYAAIALENAQLFSRMQTANIHLANAYEATIEGWSRALEMRDKETRGHSERVNRFCLSLARAMGMSEDEIVHFRRGVLLHDIGKMAIPDSILLKPGPLTEDEWVIMRQHTVYAFQMLAGIPFIGQALDIPYCHHEKWDGTGYPRGLKGEEIPLGARIFAVVDVWDALTYDRPYRPAWPPGAVRANIAAQSGRHFDPQVVAVFLELLDAGCFM
jgi:HD-GYP domain-containing protein (c-di-GMP phosphodiesterase class II)